MFIGSTGFTTPVYYHPTVEVDPIALYHKFWDVVFDLGEFGYKVIMAICDGAQANRTFIHLHLVTWLIHSKYLLQQLIFILEDH